MINATSLLWVWKGEAAGRWYFLTIPDEQADEIRAEAMASPRGFGSVKVEATIDAVTWRTSVFPLKRGGYVLPIKADVRKRAGLAAGDAVTVSLNLI